MIVKKCVNCGVELEKNGFCPDCKNYMNPLIETPAQGIDRRACIESMEMAFKEGIEQIFNDILNSDYGDYIFQAQILALMKPLGW